MKKLVVTERFPLIKPWAIAGFLVAFLATCGLQAEPTVNASSPISVEQLLQDTEQELTTFLKTVPLKERMELTRYSWKQHWSLSPSKQKNYETWFSLREQKEQWTKAVDLKKDLTALYPKERRREAEIVAEADQIAHKITETLTEYRKKWKMIRPAILHNFFINVGLKEKTGFCYHWVELFQGRLTPLGIDHFQLHWGVAFEGRMRENNALVITPPGGRFEEGIAIDGWRKAGRPFWVKANEDKYPWVERIDP